MNEQRGVKVVITEPVACGHFCSIVYPMEECDLTLKMGPITSINPTSVFPDFSTFFASLDRTLELSGKHGDARYIGITTEEGRFVCAKCGMVLFAIKRAEEEEV
jgi:hypothetical protein